MQHSKKIDSQFPASAGLAFVIGITFISILVYLELTLGLRKLKPLKSGLAKVYGVDAATFAKWIKYLHPVQSFYSVYTDKRKLELIEGIEILIYFGVPGEPCKTKKDIVEEGEGTYKTLRGSIKKYPEQWQITPEAFRAINKFPPSFSQHFTEKFG